MAKDLNKALQEVEMTYAEIRQLADEMLMPTFGPINNLVSEITSMIESLSIDSLRYYLLKMQLAAFQLSEIKDRSSIKAECAEAIKKEAYAADYIVQEGAAAVRDSNATLAISDNIVAGCLYNLVAALTKTKLDQCLRLCDTLKSILMSRMQEAKLSATMNE
jgi:hypothetical protein